MSTVFETSAIGWLRPFDTVTISLTFIALYAIGSIVASWYSAFYGPLSKYPGPKLRAFSVIPKVLDIYCGNEGAAYPKLHAKYGPVVRIAPNELSFVGNAQAFKDIHGTRKGASPLAKDPVFMGKPLNGVHTLLSADDANHSRQRKILSHAFADRSLKDLEPMLKQWVSTMAAKLNERAIAGDKADMLKYYNCTTFDIMADLCFNESLHMLENTEYSPWVKTIFASVKDVTPFRAVKWLGRPAEFLVDDVLFKSKYARQKAHEHWKYSADRVDKRLARAPVRSDLWTKILERSQGPGALSLDEHYATATLFMGAGTETSATCLSGMTYYLLRNPPMLAKLTEEIRTAFPTMEAVTMDGLGRLKYLQAVIQEGLRVYPPVLIALARRVPQGGAVVLGERLPQGVTVGIHQLATYRDEGNFKNAHEFHPERWLGDPEYQNDNLDALEPFSIGPRNCLGKNLAWHEIRLILATTLLHFDLHLCPESLDWSDKRVYLLWDKKPLWCTLTPAKA